MNKDKFILFGAGSFIAKKLIKNISSKNKIIGFSRKKIKRSKNFYSIKTDYKPQKIIQILKKKFHPMRDQYLYLRMGYQKIILFLKQKAVR